MRTSSLLLMLLLLIAGTAEASRPFDAYVFTRGGKSRIRSGGNVDLDAALRLAKRFEGDFLWFRDGGRAYVIRDAKTLDAIARLFVHVEALQSEQQGLHARLRPLELREHEIDRQIEQWEDRDEARARELERELRDIEKKLHALEEEEAALDRREELLEREAERKMVPALERAIREGMAQRQ